MKDRQLSCIRHSLVVLVLLVELLVDDVELVEELVDVVDVLLDVELLPIRSSMWTDLS